MNTQSYNQLSQDERDCIAVLKAKGQSVSDIARTLNRDKGTISRELRRNKSPVYDVYLPYKAQARSELRKRTAATRGRLKDFAIRRWVKRRLKDGWSPEQIAGRIAEGLPGHSISHEAIYQYVYDPRVRKRNDFVPYLARHHRKRFPKRHSRKHHNPHIPERISIMKRPKYILKRKQSGHWEADTVISRKSLESLGVAVERTSRLVKIAKLKEKTSCELRASLNRRLSRVPKSIRRTITYDNGSENVEHRKVNETLGTQSYFCEPYHSWEKGTVENTIGLIRRFLPKGTDFAMIEKEQIKRIETLLNNRPRKCLNFKTPNEIFLTQCCSC